METLEVYDGEDGIEAEDSTDEEVQSISTRESNEEVDPGPADLLTPVAKPIELVINPISLDEFSYERYETRVYESIHKLKERDSLDGNELEWLNSNPHSMAWASIVQRINRTLDMQDLLDAELNSSIQYLDYQREWNVFETSALDEAMLDRLCVDIYRDVVMDVVQNVCVAIYKEFDAFIELASNEVGMNIFKAFNSLHSLPPNDESGHEQVVIGTLKRIRCNQRNEAIKRSRQPIRLETVSALSISLDKALQQYQQRQQQQQAIGLPALCGVDKVVTRQLTSANRREEFGVQMEEISLQHILTAGGTTSRDKSRQDAIIAMERQFTNGWRRNDIIPSNNSKARSKDPSSTPALKSNISLTLPNDSSLPTCLVLMPRPSRLQSLLAVGTRHGSLLMYAVPWVASRVMPQPLLFARTANLPKTERSPVMDIQISILGSNYAISLTESGVVRVWSMTPVAAPKKPTHSKFTFSSTSAAKEAASDPFVLCCLLQINPSDILLAGQDLSVLNSGLRISSACFGPGLMLSGRSPTVAVALSSGDWLTYNMNQSTPELGVAPYMTRPCYHRFQFPNPVQGKLQSLETIDPSGPGPQRQVFHFHHEKLLLVGLLEGLGTRLVTLDASGVIALWDSAATTADVEGWTRPHRSFRLDLSLSEFVEHENSAQLLSSAKIDINEADFPPMQMNSSNLNNTSTEPAAASKRAYKYVLKSREVDAKGNIVEIFHPVLSFASVSAGPGAAARVQPVLVEISRRLDAELKKKRDSIVGGRTRRFSTKTLKSQLQGTATITGGAVDKGAEVPAVKMKTGARLFGLLKRFNSKKAIVNNTNTAVPVESATVQVPGEPGSAEANPRAAMDTTEGEQVPPVVSATNNTDPKNESTEEEKEKEKSAVDNSEQQHAATASPRPDEETASATVAMPAAETSTTEAPTSSVPNEIPGPVPNEQTSKLNNAEKRRRTIEAARRRAAVMGVDDNDSAVDGATTTTLASGAGDNDNASLARAAGLLSKSRKPPPKIFSPIGWKQRVVREIRHPLRLLHACLAQGETDAQVYVVMVCSNLSINIPGVPSDVIENTSTTSPPLSPSSVRSQDDYSISSNQGPSSPTQPQSQQQQGPIYIVASINVSESGESQSQFASPCIKFRIPPGDDVLNVTVSPSMTSETLTRFVFVHTRTSVRQFSVDTGLEIMNPLATRQFPLDLTSNFPSSSSSGPLISAVCTSQRVIAVGAVNDSEISVTLYKHEQDNQVNREEIDQQLRKSWGPQEYGSRINTKASTHPTTTGATTTLPLLLYPPSFLRSPSPASTPPSTPSLPSSALAASEEALQFIMTLVWEEVDRLGQLRYRGGLIKEIFGLSNNAPDESLGLLSPTQWPRASELKYQYRYLSPPASPRASSSMAGDDKEGILQAERSQVVADLVEQWINLAIFKACGGGNGTNDPRQDSSSNNSRDSARSADQQPTGEEEDEPIGVETGAEEGNEEEAQQEVEEEAQEEEREVERDVEAEVSGLLASAFDETGSRKSGDDDENEDNDEEAPPAPTAASLDGRDEEV